MKNLEKKIKNCVILGGGGHAAVLIELILNQNNLQVRAILDSDADKNKIKIMGIPVLGNDSLLPQLIMEGVNSFVVGIGSTGKTTLRQKIYVLGLKHNLKPISIIHPKAIIAKSAQIGRGAQIMAGVIINTKAILGENVLVNCGAIIEHDCKIGKNVHVASGATVAGGVTIGDGAHIGAGATLKQGVIIGEGTVIGAGAAVIGDIAPNITVVGVPAKKIH